LKSLANARKRTVQEGNSPSVRLTVDSAKIDPAKVREAMDREPFDGKEYPRERAAIRYVLEAISQLPDQQEGAVNAVVLKSTAEIEREDAKATAEAMERLTRVGRRKLIRR